MNVKLFLVLKYHVVIFSVYTTLLSIFIQGGCAQSTPSKEVGRWEIEANALAELQVPSPEIPVKVVLYRIDIEEDKLMSRIDIKQGLNGAIYSSFCVWRMSEGKFIVKNPDGKEISLDTKILPDGRLEMSAHPTPLAGMPFETKGDAKDIEESAKKRKLLNAIEKKIIAPLVFTRKGKAEVGDLSSP